MKADQYSAVVLDLDGVVTDTRQLHVHAWARTFNEYLESLRTHVRFASCNLKPFDPVADYLKYVDGKPRLDGIKSFLASRGITLKEGRSSDTKEKETMNGLGAKKNFYYLQLLEKEGPHVFKDALGALEIWRRQGVPVSVVSSSRNCAQVLRKAGIEQFFQERVDGLVGVKLGLRGKPAPDYFLEAARRLRIEPARMILVEDAIAGVQAGRRGKFGMVIGMDRTGENAEALLKYGANYVISSLSDVISRVGRAAA